MEFLVEDGKGVVNVEELVAGFADLSKQFFFVISNKYNCKSWAKRKACEHTINLSMNCMIETEFNKRCGWDQNLSEKCFWNSRKNIFTVVQSISTNLNGFFQQLNVNRLELSKEQTMMASKSKVI